MRLLAFGSVLSVWVGCGSETKLGDGLGTGGKTTTTTNGTGTNTETQTTNWTPGTDTPPTFDTSDTGWTWTTGTGTTTTEPGTGTGTPTTEVDTGTGTGTTTDTGLTDDELCLKAQGLAGYLDAFQTAYDGRVYYCHSSSGANWVFVESDISSCLPHLNHNFDVFPTTGCDS